MLEFFSCMHLLRKVLGISYFSTLLVLFCYFPQFFCVFLHCFWFFVLGFVRFFPLPLFAPSPVQFELPSFAADCCPRASLTASRPLPTSFLPFRAQSHFLPKNVGPSGLSTRQPIRPSSPGRVGPPSCSAVPRAEGFPCTGGGQALFFLKEKFSAF